MTLASCLRTVPVDPDDLAEIRKLVKESGDEAAGIEKFLDGLKADFEDARGQLVRRGYKVEKPVSIPQGWGDVDGGTSFEFTPADKAAVDKIVADVAGLDAVEYVDRIPIPNYVEAWGKTSGFAGGYYTPSLDAITIARSTAGPRVAYHEAFHRLQNRFLTESEMEVLKEEAVRLRRIINGDPNRQGKSGVMAQKELEAEAFAIWASGQSQIAAHRGFRRGWEALASMFRRVASYLKGRGFITSEDIFAKAKAGGIKAREPQVSVATKREFSAVTVPSPTPESITQAIRDKLVDLTPSALAAIPLNYFVELARPNMKAVKEYMHVKRYMDAYRGDRHAKADEVAQDWLKYASLGLMGKNKAAAAELADLMHNATLAGMDPSKPIGAEAADVETYEALKSRFLALPEKGKAMFNRVRDAYKEQQAELDKLLIANVEKAHRIAQKRAIEEHEKELNRIDRAGLTPEARKDAIADAKKAHEVAMGKALWSMKARITKLRRMFESNRVKEPYFPLGRFGNFSVSVRDASGQLISFSKRETMGQANRLAADMRKEFPNADVSVGRMDEKSSSRDNIDPRTVAEVEEILSGLNVDPANKEAIYDQLWQRFLEGLPDLSVRKRFIHRKGTAGYEQDALRTFSNHMFHAAHQMAKLKYGMELQELIHDIKTQAHEADDTVTGVAISNEMAKRHEWVMKPTGGKLAQNITTAAFVWYLATTPAAALVNISQTPILGIPILAGRFGSVTKAAGAIAQAGVDIVRGKGSIGNANLSKEEKAALDVFYSSGLIDRTQSHDLAGVGDTGVTYSPVRSKIMGIMSYLFHKTEVWNREATALAAYRMAKADGKNWEQAVDIAHDLTWRTHFDYSNSSRPRLMQNDFAKVALVFRSYNINMLYRLTRDLKQSIAGETAQAKREARYQLAGVLGMMSLLGGVTGVAGFNLMMLVAAAVFGDDDDPIDFQTRFRADVMDLLGPELGGILLDGAIGHYTGVDLTSRLGMADLWFRSPSGDLKGQDEYEYWVMNSLGAAVSMGGKMFSGYQMIQDGNTVRGIEAMSPKFIGDLMKTYRYAFEGVTDSRGNVVLDADDITYADLFKQAMGFTPAKVAEAWDRNRALKNAEDRISTKRQTLINAFALAQEAGDDAEMQEALEDIEKFNSVPAHAPVAIKGKNLMQSIKTRARNDAARIDGALIQNKALGFGLSQELPPAIYR